MAAQGDAWVFDIESKTWEEMIFSEPLGTRWFHTGGVIQVSSTSVSAVVDVITVGGVRESWKKYGRENNSWPCISGTQVATLEFLLNDRKIDGPIGWSGKKRRNLTDTTESAEKQFEDAMKKGKIKSKLMKMVLYGSAGSGKTSFKHLLIGDPPPQRRKSTPLAVRPISMHRVDMKSEKWKRLTPEEREQYLSRAIKSHSSHSTSLSPSTSSAVGSETDDVFTYGPTVDANLEGNEESITHPASSSTESAPNIEESSDSSIDEHILHVISTDDKLVDQVDQLITPGFGSNSESLDLFKLFRMLQIVDSGGQPQFHDILPIFLTELSFYTFVFKLSDELESYPTVEYYDENGKRIGEPYTSHLTNEQLLQHCIQTMKSHWNSTSIKEEEHANILILGTHRDKKCKRETQEEKDIKIRDILLPQCEKEVIYPGSNSAHSTKKVIFAVNAKSPNKDDKEIAKDIRNCLDEKCTEEVLIPLNWYALEILLEELTILKKRGVLSFDECLLAASEKLKFDKESLKSALNFLHGLSVVFYYPDFLEAVVFVNPQVLLDKVTELVKAKYRTKKAFSNQWKDFYDKALVSVGFLSKNEFNEHYVDGLFTATELVVLFKNLFILADFIDDKLFMPALLSRVDVAKYHATTPESCVPPLVVKFSHGNLLPGVFCALICFLLNRSPAPWKLNTYPEDKVTPTYLHRNCVEFSICDDFPGTVTLIDSCKHLECYLSLNKEPEEEELDPHLLIHVRCCILDAVHTGLDKANEALHYSNSSCEYSIALLCPCSNKSKVHTASASRGRWRCSINAKKHGRLTTDQKFWLDQEQGPSSETLSPRGDREASTSSVQHTEGISALGMFHHQIKFP
jgi:GTPase SAR1 family protein